VANQLLRERSYPIVTAAPTKVNPHVASIDPAQVSQRLRERGVAELQLRIVFVNSNERADAPHLVALLGPCR
jgi:hypothetical protein